MSDEHYLIIERSPEVSFIIPDDTYGLSKQIGCICVNSKISLNVMKNEKIIEKSNQFNLQLQKKRKNSTEKNPSFTWRLIK